MGKKRIAKKRIVKRKTVKKEVKKGIPDVSKMSRLEYEQSLLDPRFRAAMIGVHSNGLPQANNTLRDLETKNNELTKQMTSEQEIFNQREKYIKLKAQLKADEIQHKSETDRLNNELKTQQLIKNIELQDVEHKRKIEELQHEKELQSYKQGKENEILKYKNEIETQKRRHQDEMEKSKLKFQAESLEKDKKHQDEIIPLQQSINKLKIDSERKEFEFKKKQEIENTNANLDIETIKKATQEAVNPLLDRIQKLENSRKVADAEFKAASDLSNANRDLRIAQTKSDFQQKAQPIQHEINEINNNINVNHEVFEAEEKLNNLKTQKKIVEQKVPGQSKKKHDKEVQQAQMKVGSMQKQIELVEDTAKVKEQADKARQELITKALLLDPKIKDEEINNFELYQKKMVQIKVDNQNKIKTLEQQTKIANDAMKKQKQFEDMESKAYNKNIEYFANHSAMRDYAEKVLGYKTTAEKFQHIDEIHKSFYEAAAKNADFITHIPQQSFADEKIRKAEQVLSDFSEAYETATGLNIESERERINNEEYQSRLKQAEARKTELEMSWLYNQLEPEAKRQFDEQFPSHKVQDWNDTNISSDED